MILVRSLLLCGVSQGFDQRNLERDREAFSSGSKPLGRLSSGFSSPGKSFHHQPNHGELHHTFAAAR